MDITISYAVIIFIAAIAIGGLGVVLKFKTETRKMMGWLALIGGVVGLLGVAGIIPQLQETAFGQTYVSPGGTTITYTTPSTTPQTVSAACAEDTTVRLSAINKYTQAATGGTHRYSLNGNPALTVSDAGTFTASPGDSYKILFENASSTTYYGGVKEGVIGCGGAETISAEVVQNGTGTIDVFNEEGNLISATANNETLAAGDRPTLEIKLRGAYQKGLPYGGVMVAEWNNTDFDEVIVDLGGKETSVPGVYSIVYGTNSQAKAYTVPPLLSSAILTGTVVLDVDDTTNPANDNAARPLLTLYGNDYFINEDTGGSFDGPAPEDEDDVVTFGIVQQQYLAVQ